MDVYTMVVIIVAFSCGAGVVNNYLKTRRLELKQAPSADVDAEVESLKQRVAVLEEIVTDDRYRLNRELDQLERRA
jgi:hypothetical protein